MEENLVKFSIKKKHVTIISIIIVLCLAIGITYAFFEDREGPANTGVDVESAISKATSFIEGIPINLLLSEDNLYEGAGSLTGETTSSVLLKADSTNELVTINYHVMFDIGKNTFEYTTKENKAEMILQITDPEGNNICSETTFNEICTSIKVNGEVNNELKYVEAISIIENEDGTTTIETITGIDITEFSGHIMISQNHSISTTNSETGIKQDWNAKITFVNLDTHQYENDGKELTASLILSDDAELLKHLQDFTFINDIQEFIVPNNGYYQIETWGAQGGGSSSIYGGEGSYTSGMVYLEKGEVLYLQVGGQGSFAATTNDLTTSGYNGGGAALGKPEARTYFYGGGGSTDVRISSGEWNNDLSLNSRIMVAAGGSGDSLYISEHLSSPGGGLIGYDGTFEGGGGYSIATAGTNTQWGIGGGIASSYAQAASGQFGIGGNSNPTPGYGSGAGSGYYGGGGGGVNIGVVGSGASGSSFISGHTGTVAITSADNRTPLNRGDLLVDFYVRYIEIGSSGSTVSVGNHVSEVEVYDIAGNNIALGKIAMDSHSTFPLVTDGDLALEPHSTHGSILTIDLEQEYELSSIKLWRYYDGRIFYNTYVKVYNEDKTKSVYLHNYETDGTYVETAEGKTMQIAGVNKPCETGTTNNSCSLHYSGKYFTDTVMIDGAGYNWTNVIGEQVAMPNPLGGYYELGEGHTGNGYARISRVYNFE